MERLSVRSVSGEERMKISFVFSERIFNFDRLRTEELSKTLFRMKANIAKAVYKNKKKKSKPSDECTESGEEDVALELYEGNDRVDENNLNWDVWKEGFKLRVSSTWYTVQVNPPKIKRVILPKIIMVGFPIYPNIDAEFVDLNHCVMTWYREEKSFTACKFQQNTAPSVSHEICDVNCDINNKNENVEVSPVLSTEERTESEFQSHPETPSPSSEVKSHKDLENVPNSNSVSEVNWTEIMNGLVYAPVAGDVGFKLKLVCTPSDGTRVGEESEVVSTEVITGPGRCAFEKRHDLTRSYTQKGCFRVVSYNILADLFSDTDFHLNYRYPHCPAYAIETDYRKQILIKELTGYNADVLCLQEVDRHLFNADLDPILEMFGLKGRLKAKIDSSEGEAIFWRKDKFRSIGEHDLHLSEALQKDPLYQDLYDKIASNDAVLQKLLGRKNILQVCALESVENPKQLLLVANTHLFFRPRAGHERLLQTALCLRHLSHLSDQYKLERGGEPAMVFCGDFNSTPRHGVYELLLNGQIPSTHADWYSEGRDEFIPDYELQHPFKLTCASGTPSYTNYVPAFADCLDYILINDKLMTSQVIPLPTHQEITQFSALPNQCFPSDHLALACDIRWR